MTSKDSGVQTDLTGDEKNSPSNVQVGGKEIQAVTGDADVESILGWVATYTIGPVFTVDRGWLEEQANELGIPSEQLPSETSPKRAFTRACIRLRDDSFGVVPEGVEPNTERKDYNTFELEITDRREDGEVNTEIIGELQYEDSDVYVQAKTSNPEYLDFYQRYAEKFRSLFETMKTSNMGKDIRKATRQFATEHSTAVKIRNGGAVYFVPAHYEEGLMAWKELISRINSVWKDHGHEAALETIEVIDSPGKREMVERKVRESLEESVEKLVETALDELDEEQAANEVVASLADDLSEMENLASEHNALLNADISVRSSLESWKEQVEDDKEELVSKLVNEVDV